MSSQVSHLSIYLWAKTHKGEKIEKKEYEMLSRHLL